MEKKKIQQRIHKLWQAGKKDLDKILKEASRLAKKGEIHLKKASKKAEQNLEAMVLSLQKEKLYYELGKSLVRTSKKQWTKSKKLEGLLAKVRNINRNIREAKRK